MQDNNLRLQFKGFLEKIMNKTIINVTIGFRGLSQRIINEGLNFKD